MLDMMQDYQGLVQLDESVRYLWEPIPRGCRCSFYANDGSLLQQIDAANRNDAIDEFEQTRDKIGDASPFNYYEGLLDEESPKRSFLPNGYKPIYHW